MREFDFQSADFYKFLIERSPELISFHTPDGIFLYVSPSVTSILGYQPEELIGKNPYDYFSPLDKNRIFENSHQPILEGKEIEYVEYQFLKKDGKYVWLQSITQSIRDEQGIVIALFSSSREYLGFNAILDKTEKNRLSTRFVFRKKSFSMRFTIRVSAWRLFL